MAIYENKTQRNLQCSFTQYPIVLKDCIFIRQTLYVVLDLVLLLLSVTKAVQAHIKHMCQILSFTLRALSVDAFS